MDITPMTAVDQIRVIVACMTRGLVLATVVSTETIGQALAIPACTMTGPIPAMAVFTETTGLALATEASTTRVDLVLAMGVTEEPTLGTCDAYRGHLVTFLKKKRFSSRSCTHYPIIHIVFSLFVAYSSFTIFFSFLFTYFIAQACNLLFLYLSVPYAIGHGMDCSRIVIFA